MIHPHIKEKKDRLHIRRARCARPAASHGGTRSGFRLRIGVTVCRGRGATRDYHGSIRLAIHRDVTVRFFARKKRRVIAIFEENHYFCKKSSLCHDISTHSPISVSKISSQKTFMSRALYYLCRAISDQGEIGDDWQYDFEPVFGVYFVDFYMPGLSADVRSHAMIADVRSGKPVTDKMCLSFIQLDRFAKTAEECLTGFDQWIYVLKNLDTMEAMPFTAEKQIFKKVQTVSDYHRLNKEDRDEYQAALKRYRDYNCTLSTAREEGMEAGVAKGRADTSREYVRAMLRLGVDINIICQVSGMTPEEIKAL